ncbi:MAG: glycosyltransferase family 9 protein [Proteobacteria bacterium]|nr:glycosyltransferase family 9 protein [Pseudomonadota bacterium]
MNPPFADALLGWAVSRRLRAGHAIAPLATLDPAGLERVLVVLTTGLGDAVLSTPVFPALRRALPKADLRLFVRAQWAGLFEADPDLDGLIRYPGKYRRFFPTLAALRRFAPQLTVVLHGNDPDIVPLAYLAGSRHIVRIPTAGTRWTHLLSNAAREEDARTVDGLHYVDNRLRILDTLGIARAERSPRIRLPEEARSRAAAMLAAHIGAAPYWVYHAFAADPYKCWPLPQARAFLESALAAHPSHAVVLTGAPSERARLVSLAEGLPPPRIAVVAGELSLVESAGALLDARCVVGPDTGMLHLAAALDRPVIGLYAPTFATLVGPLPPRARVITLQKPQTCDPCIDKRCPHVPNHCMRQIGAAEAAVALAAQLAPRGAS